MNLELRPTMNPKDWPATGPIELSIHDRPHTSSDVEWWYQNCHLTTEDGRSVGLFAAFFRVRLSESRHAHFLTWALSEPQGARYWPSALVDPATIELARQKLEIRQGDPRIKQSLHQALSRGSAVAPTRLFQGPITAATEALDLDYAGQRFSKKSDGSYRLILFNEQENVGAALSFRPRKASVRHGDEGVVHGADAERMFYYFLSRCEVSGEVTFDQKTLSAQGEGWCDHEFGYVPKDAAVQPQETAWNWAAVQLDDGSELSVYLIQDTGTGATLDRWLVVHGADGRVERTTRVSFTPVSNWRSHRTFIDYPIEWTLLSEDLNIALTIKTTFPDQEVVTMLSEPAFWEGQVSVEGTHAGYDVRGRGWVERKGHKPRSISEILSAAGGIVLQEVAHYLPRQATDSHLLRHVSALTSPRFFDDFPREAYEQALIAPIRDMIDRGGKAWRSCLLHLCIEMVGGDSRRFPHWLAIPELLHVGSLIVDDVEDKSDVRRGGPTCHQMYGEPLALNAGSAAYFLAEPPVERDELPAEKKLKIYRYYFEAMRAGHAGQALDLAGLGQVAQAAAESGDTRVLEARILAIHRLKSALPPSALARIGAILGGGTEAQIEALGHYVEALGLAFQIVDDVLNLRGFQGNLKTKGEDISQGKCTLPVARALGLLDSKDRHWLWTTLRSQSSDAETVSAVIQLIERAGANESCMNQALQLIEDSWQELDQALPDSQAKVLFRSFSYYLLERHY